MKTNEYEKLLTPHLDACYALALRLTRRPEEAEDLVQEVCLKGWDRIEQLRDPARIKSWLMTIMMNTFTSLKRHDRHDPIDHSMALDEVEEILATPSSSGLAIAGLSAEEVRRAIDQLPEAMRVPLWLSDVEGYSCREIAELLACPIGTVATRVARARQRLRASLVTLVEQGGR